MEKKDKIFIFAIVSVVIVTIISAACVVLLNLNKTQVDIKPDDNQNKVTHTEEQVKEDALVLLGKLSGSYDALYGYKGEINSLPNSNKVYLAFWLLKDDITGKGIDDYTSEQITDTLKNVFGSSFNITFEDFEGYKYNATTKKYESVPQEAHGISVNIGSLVKSDLVDYKEENGKYVITYKQVFKKSDEEKDIYTDITTKELLTHALSEDEADLESINKENITSVKYTFVYEKDVLVLKSISY